jgi:hypothetical protein
MIGAAALAALPAISRELKRLPREVRAGAAVAEAATVMECQNP